jgi:hypothetical protein
MEKLSAYILSENELQRIKALIRDFTYLDRPAEITRKELGLKEVDAQAIVLRISRGQYAWIGGTSYVIWLRKEG